MDASEDMLRYHPLKGGGILPENFENIISR